VKQPALVALLSVAAAFLWGYTAASQVVWTPAHELAPPVVSGFVGSGDLDGDGDDDVSGFGWRNQYWNMGCPGPPAWQLQEGAFPDVAACTENSGTLGDCDADGDLDLVYGCWECCSLRMIWNVGTPQAPVWQHSGAIAGNPYAGYEAYDRLADIDADGDLDLVGTSSGGAVGVFENTGTPEAPCWVWLGLIPGIGFGASDGILAVGDLDGDGDLDIVGGSSFSRVKCWENVGTSQVWSYIRNDAMLTGVTATAIGVYGVALPDVDCDGDCDLLIVGRIGGIYLYLNERITPVRPGSWGTIKALYRQ